MDGDGLKYDMVMKPEQKKLSRCILFSVRARMSFGFLWFLFHTQKSQSGFQSNFSRCFLVVVVFRIFEGAQGSRPSIGFFFPGLMFRSERPFVGGSSHFF